MINPFKEVNWNPGTAEKRKFAVSLMIGFPALGLLMLLIGRLTFGAWHPGIPIILAAVGFGIGAVLWSIPQIAKPFYVVWYLIACCLGIVIGNLLLATLYYTVVTITGLALRALGRRPVLKRPIPSATTYWTDVEENSDVNRYFRQF
jgi:hypothetical protein